MMPAVGTAPSVHSTLRFDKPPPHVTSHPPKAPTDHLQDCVLHALDDAGTVVLAGHWLEGTCLPLPSWQYTVCVLMPPEHGAEQSWNPPLNHVHESVPQVWEAGGRNLGSQLES